MDPKWVEYDGYQIDIPRQVEGVYFPTGSRRTVDSHEHDLNFPFQLMQSPAMDAKHTFFPQEGLQCLQHHHPSTQLELP